MWAYRPNCKQGRLLHCLRFKTKMPVRYRRAKPEEIPHVLRLLEPDRPLFSSSTWTALPQLLKDLLERERILLCVIEGQDSHNLRFAGGSGFLTSTFLRAALDHSTENILELAFAAERAQQPAFLNVKQVAAANRSGDLRPLMFFGTTGSLDPGDPKASIEMSLVLEAWNFFHRGFQFREVWAVTASAVQAEILNGTSLRLFRRGTTRSGASTWLFTISREEALRNPAGWPNSHILSPLPIFRFTRTQQKLLELALLDYSDREAAIELQVSPDAVKKRWRSIYERVSQAEPALFSHNVSGADHRRLLLHRLRLNLAELRPY